MGNCLVSESKIRVAKIDGKVLEYQVPIRVHQVLAEFSGHALSDNSFSSFQQHLRPDAKLVCGNLYYLIPLSLPSSSSPKVKKKVSFFNPEVEDEQGKGVVRIKLVISKQELQEMLQKEGVSVDDMISKARMKQSNNSVSGPKTDCRGWTPALESIDELD